jgi:CDGSH-type Zn-finger protein
VREFLIDHKSEKEEMTAKTNNEEQQEEDLSREKPRIVPLPNGPFYFINDMEPKLVENLQNSKGEALSVTRGVSLCRCGASNNKPFCDGTHPKIGFSSENKEEGDTNNSHQNQMVKDKRKNYVGKGITIHDNRKICSHAAECVSNFPYVFKEIRALYGSDIGITTSKAIIQSIGEFTAGFGSVISSIALVVLLVGSVGIVTTMYTSVTERTREIGFMKAIGARDRNVLALLLTE